MKTLNRKVVHRIEGMAAALPLATLALSLAALVPTLLPVIQQPLALHLDSSAGWWQGLTCHFVHWNTDHLFWSLGAFAVLGMICELRNPVRFASAIALSGTLIPLALCATSPAMHVYAGLSGIDSALFVLLALRFARDEFLSGSRMLAMLGAMMLVAFGGKVLYEVLYGTPMFAAVGSDFMPVPLAHLAGGLAGIVAAVFPDMTRWSPRTPVFP